MIRLASLRPIGSECNQILAAGYAIKSLAGGPRDSAAWGQEQEQNPRLGGKVMSDCMVSWKHTEEDAHVLIYTH